MRAQDVFAKTVTGQLTDRPTRRQSNSPTIQFADNQIADRLTRQQSNAPTNQLAKIEIVTEIDKKNCLGTRTCLSGKLAEEIWRHFFVYMLVCGATTLTVNMCTCNKPASISN